MDTAALRLSAESWVGRTVARKYRVEELIGIGGMGAVFQARGARSAPRADRVRAGLLAALVRSWQFVVGTYDYQVNQKRVFVNGKDEGVAQANSNATTASTMPATAAPNSSSNLADMRRA